MPTEAVFTHETEKEAHGLCVVISHRGCVFSHNYSGQPELISPTGLRQEQDMRLVRRSDWQVRSCFKCACAINCIFWSEEEISSGKIATSREDIFARSIPAQVLTLCCMVINIGSDIKRRIITFVHAQRPMARNPHMRNISVVSMLSYTGRSRVQVTHLQQK